MIKKAIIGTGTKKGFDLALSTGNTAPVLKNLKKKFTSS
jgi:hypothetical protein